MIPTKKIISPENVWKKPVDRSGSLAARSPVPTILKIFMNITTGMERATRRKRRGQSCWVYLAIIIDNVRTDISDLMPL